MGDFKRVGRTGANFASIRRLISFGGQIPPTGDCVSVFNDGLWFNTCTWDNSALWP